MPNLRERMERLEKPFVDEDEKEKNLKVLRYFAQANGNFTFAGLHRSFYYMIVVLCGSKARGTPTPNLPFWRRAVRNSRGLRTSAVFARVRTPRAAPRRPPRKYAPDVVESPATRRRQIFGPLKEHLDVKNLDPRQEQQSNDKKNELIKVFRIALYAILVRKYHESDEFARDVDKIWDVGRRDLVPEEDSDDEDKDDETEPGAPGATVALDPSAMRRLNNARNRKEAFDSAAYYAAFMNFLRRYQSEGGDELKLFLALRVITTEFEMYKVACKCGQSESITLLVKEGLKRWDAFNRTNYALADAELVLSPYARSARRNRIFMAHEALFLKGVFGKGTVLDGWQELLVAHAKEGVRKSTGPGNFENAMFNASINGQFLKNLKEAWEAAISARDGEAQRKREAKSRTAYKAKVRACRQLLDRAGPLEPSNVETSTRYSAVAAAAASVTVELRGTLLQRCKQKAFERGPDNTGGQGLVVIASNTLAPSGQPFLRKGAVLVGVYEDAPRADSPQPRTRPLDPPTSNQSMDSKLSAMSLDPAAPPAAAAAPAPSPAPAPAPTLGPYHRVSKIPGTYTLHLDGNTSLREGDFMAQCDSAEFHQRNATRAIRLTDPLIYAPPTRPVEWMANFVRGWEVVEIHRDGTMYTRGEKTADVWKQEVSKAARRDQSHVTLAPVGGRATLSLLDVFRRDGIPIDASCDVCRVELWAPGLGTRGAVKALTSASADAAADAAAPDPAAAELPGLKEATPAVVAEYVKAFYGVPELEETLAKGSIVRAAELKIDAEQKKMRTKEKKAKVQDFPPEVTKAERASSYDLLALPGHHKSAAWTRLVSWHKRQKRLIELTNDVLSGDESRLVVGANPQPALDSAEGLRTPSDETWAATQKLKQLGRERQRLVEREQMAVEETDSLLDQHSAGNSKMYHTSYAALARFANSNEANTAVIERSLAAVLQQLKEKQAQIRDVQAQIYKNTSDTIEAIAVLSTRVAADTPPAAPDEEDPGIPDAQEDPDEEDPALEHAEAEAEDDGQEAAAEALEDAEAEAEAEQDEDDAVAEDVAFLLDAAAGPPGHDLTAIPEEAAPQL